MNLLYTTRPHDASCERQSRIVHRSCGDGVCGISAAAESPGRRRLLQQQAQANRTSLQRFPLRTVRQAPRRHRPVSRASCRRGDETSRRSVVKQHYREKLHFFFITFYFFFTTVGVVGLRLRQTMRWRPFLIIVFREEAEQRAARWRCSSSRGPSSAT